ncbi:MAG TPA: type VI secretion system baseplate subunit TssE [Candidatus Acidoferrum sp.]|nr:type VI secretion system baseplate subunit TssE [Candidatus Acidoferrum sp.]
MAQRETTGPVTLTVLDRLIDEEPKSQVEAPLTYSKSLAKLKVGLRRDLENLLNSRQNPEGVPESCVETAKSVHMYGFPDVSSLPANFLYDQNRLVSLLQETLSTFEPRLEGIKVTLVPATDTSRVVRFVIEGMLMIDPTPEHVVYDAALELTSGTYQVSGDTSAG